jgi:methionyl-tRNA synthetase
MTASVRHLTRPELVEEKNYFFRLSRYADQLRDDRERSTQDRPTDAQAGPILICWPQDFVRARARARNGHPVLVGPGRYLWFDAGPLNRAGLPTVELYQHCW